MKFVSYCFTLRKKYSSLLTIGFAASICASCQLLEPGYDTESTTRSGNFEDGEFQNLQQENTNGLGGSFSSISRTILDSRDEPKPTKPIPLQEIDIDYLGALPNDKTSIIRLGHSTVLLKINGEYWLTDPIFSQRAARFQFSGPKRFHDTPISIENLPKIKGVLISHNHFDHMDENSIKALRNKVERFYVPLKNGQLLEDWGIEKRKIRELDWGQSRSAGSVTVTATPAQHFSGRGYTDSNEMLWSSWVLTTDNIRIFYSGSSGYFSGFRDIGFKYGPFDLTIMEAGAYDEKLNDMHMTPDQTVQAHIDLRGTLLLPVHNATFDLAYHSWFEPLQKVTDLGKERGQIILTPTMGQAVTLGNTASTVGATNQDWWNNLKEPEPEEDSGSFFGSLFDFF